MHWEFNFLTSVTLLAALQGNEVEGMSQETSYVIECIRDMIPSQVYNDCCNRETNCTIAKQQNRALDCMARIIMTNYSSLFSESRESGQGTTDMNYNNNNNNRNQWYGDVLESIAELCRRQTRSRLQACIRNDLIKRCRYSMLQDRFTTSATGRWGQRRTESDYDHYGSYDQSHNRRQTHYSNNGNGMRHHHQQDQYLLIGRPEYNSGRFHYSTSRGGGSYGGGEDEEDFGYSDSDESGRYH